MGLHAPRLCIIKRTAPGPCQGACARGLQAAARAHVRVCDLARWGHFAHQAQKLAFVLKRHRFYVSCLDCKFM